MDTKDIEFISIGFTELNKENFMPVRNNTYLNKPRGGFWASPFLGLEHEYVSPWHEWCHYNDFQRGLSSDSIIFKLKDTANIYIIDNYADLIGLFEYGIYVCDIFYSLMLDFEKISKSFDGLYLTQNGEIDTRRPFAFASNECSLYGWDCESLLLFNLDCIESARYQGLNILKAGIDNEQ